MVGNGGPFARFRFPQPCGSVVRAEGEQSQTADMKPADANGFAANGDVGRIHPGDVAGLHLGGHRVQQRAGPLRRVRVGIGQRAPNPFQPGGAFVPGEGQVGLGQGGEPFQGVVQQRSDPVPQRLGFGLQGGEIGGFLGEVPFERLGLPPFPFQTTDFHLHPVHLREPFRLFRGPGVPFLLGGQAAFHGGNGVPAHRLRIGIVPAPNGRGERQAQHAGGQQRKPPAQWA